MKNEIYDSLIKILDDYTNCQWREEPLDGDEVDELTEVIRRELNKINGNI